MGVPGGFGATLMRTGRTDAVLLGTDPHRPPRLPFGVQDNSGRYPMAVFEDGRWEVKWLVGGGYEPGVLNAWDDGVQD